MKELEKLEFQKKSELVRRSIERMEKDNEYLTVNIDIDTRHSKLESYAETSVENTFRQRNDTSKKTNTYMDTEDRRDLILDSPESRSKSRTHSKSDMKSRSLSKSDIEASSKYRARNESMSDKKNSTIKEASASNMEETLNMAFDLNDDSRNKVTSMNPFRRP